VDWANERYVRLYVRDSTTWKLLDWRARCTLTMLLRKVDRAGVLEVGEHGVLGLAAVIELPLEVVEPGITQLMDPKIGVVVATPTHYVVPNYLDAQEAVQTEAHRSREYRGRKRDMALATAKGFVTKRDATATPRGDDDMSRDETVTRRHAASQTVTPIRSEPIPIRDPEISPARARAIPPSTVPAPPAPERDAIKRRLKGFAWQYAGQRYGELGQQGIDITAPNCWSGMPSAGSKPMKELDARIDELLDGQAPTEEAAREVIRRRVDVAAAEGIHKHRRDFMTPMRLWNADSFWIAADMSPQQVGREANRAGPRSTGAIGSAAPTTGHGTEAEPFGKGLR
jgi:hypothetical protein